MKRIYYISNQKVNHDYKQWLDTIKWKYFATFTAKRPMSLNSVRRLMRIFAHLICKDEGEMMAWFAEPFAMHNDYHAHALIISHYPAGYIYEKWFHRYGRIKIEQYDPNIGAGGYCSKNITKENGDWDIELGNRRYLPRTWTGKNKL